MRGRSYSPSPPPRGGYGRRRSPSPRGRFDGRGGGGRGNSGASDAPTSLLVRNLRRDCRQEDLRRPFAQFGLVKDIYLPRDYYTGEPRGFGFVQFVDPTDAADAKYHMDGQVLQGRQLTVVFAEENRKKPTDMRARERGSSHRGRVNDRRRSPPPRGGGGGGGYSRSPRGGGGGGGYSRSPPPRNARSRSPGYSPPPKRREQHSRSISPQEKGYSRERALPRHSRERSYSRSPPPGREHPPAVRERSPPPYEGGGVRNRGGRSPVRGEASPIRGESRSPSRSRSRSIDQADYSREPGTGRID